MNDPSGINHMFWSGMGGWMFLWWIVIVIIIVASISFFVRQGNPNREKSALDILKERYARGEISKEDFEERKRTIL
ncbi:MAG: SHOCT domain-containing protein [Pseudobdellovibrionaceae bacterium]